MNKITLITGATSGIGRSCAYLFAQNNHDLILTGRRKNRLDEISSDLESKYNIEVLPLTLDIRDNEAVKKSISSLPHD